MFDSLVSFIRDQYRNVDFIPLHAPVFKGKERAYVTDALDSTFVSSVGAYVDRFESGISNYTGAPRAIATVNGTAALHVALTLAGVKSGDLVITQALTFVATCNAIAYCGAAPIFVDVDRDTLGLSPYALGEWLHENAYVCADGFCRTKMGERIIRAVIVMHTFGHPSDLDKLSDLSKQWNLVLVEDAAESLGSFYKGRHTGTVGQLGTLSFNGNKIITTGGGGMILADAELGRRAKHLTTTAKLAHPYEFFHDEVGFNYRLPNLNAALGCAQLEQIEPFVAAKRDLAERYELFFKNSDVQFFREPADCRSNYWLNAVICESRAQRDKLLKTTNERGVMTRPIWTLMNRLPAFKDALAGSLTISQWMEDRVVNLPSSILPEHQE